MEEIPVDVRLEAVKALKSAWEEHCDEVFKPLSNIVSEGMWLRFEEHVARAILSERARCANLAKAMLVFADTTSGADEAIPQAIMDPNHWLAKNPERAAELAP